MQTPPTVAPEQATSDSRARRLKAATHATHDLLDRSIMAQDPFSAVERYVLFLKVQHSFHRDIDSLYDDAALGALLPDMEGRRRFPLVSADLAALDADAPVESAPPAFTAGAEVDIPTALGWLYVAEGSNLGAAILLKEAAKLGLTAEMGARHLAGAPEGRGLHWRTFTAALDAIELTDDEEARVIAGAETAFRRVHALVEQQFA